MIIDSFFYLMIPRSFASLRMTKGGRALDDIWRRLWMTLSGELFFNGFEERLQEFFLGEFVTGVLGAFVEGFPDVQVVTEFDVLTVSDGTSFVTAHTGGTYNLVAGELELLAALLHEARQMWIGFLFHFSFDLNVFANVVFFS